MKRWYLKRGGLRLLAALLSIAGVGASPLIGWAAEITATLPTPLPALYFSDASGKPVTVGDFHGKPLVLNLWATWCAPCLAEMPALDALAASGVTVVAVSEDTADPDLPTRFLTHHALNHLALYRDPSGGVGEALGASALPLTVLINAQGQEVGRALGAIDWHDPAVRASVDHLWGK